MIFRSFCLLAFFALRASAAELVTLDETNYTEFAPAGKEADAIHGDWVLRNDELIAVVAAPDDERDANMTVRNVGGSIIDLTQRDQPNDQLSCFYPGGGAYQLGDTIEWRSDDWGTAEGQTLAFAGKRRGRADSPLTIAVGYELREGEAFVCVATTLTNTGSEAVEINVSDGLRADGKGFKFGVDHEANLYWAYDQYWQQAYGLQPTGEASLKIDRGPKLGRRRPRQVAYVEKRRDETPVMLAAGESFTWSRRLFPARTNVRLQTLSHQFLGTPLAPVRIAITDGVRPIERASVRVIHATVHDGRPELVSIGVEQTGADGLVSLNLPLGEYTLRVNAEGHGSTKATYRVSDDQIVPGEAIERVAAGGEEDGLRVVLPKCAYSGATITDGNGQPIPAKVQIIGTGKTPLPNFGPDTAVHGVKNLQYTADGTFHCKLLPGSYRWIASYGPEHDAAYGEFTVAADETARIEARLERTVDTTGWLSSELHSHSSPSGDNTTSQRGRVLNLLAEHLEFCPCTEHQRIDVYDEHLEHFKAQDRMLTCPGMELTGSPLPLNHQNAFPLVHKPHEQDGGGPHTDPNPVVQIQRLAEWDDRSDKLVQTNHPDLAQMIGDRDQDGTPDGGFEKMFGFMDVLEVHPPELIFASLDPTESSNSGVGNGGWDNRGNAIVNWLQMLNLGYRVTGVVNTDSHYNFHGSGWMRNWVRSATDDPAEASVEELVHEFEHGHVVMSNGPFMSVQATSPVADSANALPGDDLPAPTGKASVRVVVRCPNWMEVNRVQLFLNGRPVPEHNYTVRSHADWFSPGPDVFDREIELAVEEDTHVVVACCGEGRSVRSMYGGDEIDQTWGRQMPVAVANPIFFDTNGDADGDGIVFEPNGDPLGLPLPTAEDLKPSHGHDHPNHRH